jgi:bifunctional non-homologous end joining protein LigD
VVAYSSRAKAGAPVSTPVSWQELRRLKSPQQFTVENFVKRLKTLKDDPWAELPSLRQSLTAQRKKSPTKSSASKLRHKN